MRIFFFFKQKTAYEVRISDWSSDVCSADLNRPVLLQFRRKGERHRPVEPDRIRVGILPVGLQVHARTFGKGDDLRTRPGRPHRADHSRYGPNRIGLEFLLAQHSRPRLEDLRSEEHTSELQSLMHNSYAVF